MTHSPLVGWYGKLPSAGDFLQRRFPDTLVHQWSQWFLVGLQAWRQEASRRDENQFKNAPVWNFILPPMPSGQMVQMGCLIPGHDRVGRQYPLCAQIAFHTHEWTPDTLAQAGEWYQQVGNTLLRAVRCVLSAEQLDQILLAISAPTVRGKYSVVPGVDRSGLCGQNPCIWQLALDCFEPRRTASFWWANREDGGPLYTYVHSGHLTAQLFTLLFDSVDEGRSERQGLYPLMFE